LRGNCPPVQKQNRHKEDLSRVALLNFELREYDLYRGFCSILELQPCKPAKSTEQNDISN